MKDEIIKLFKQPNSYDDLLPIKIGNEIYRLKNRLIKVASQADDFKQILNSINRMQTILEEEGFEIIDLINTTYSTGMAVKVRFILANSPAENNKISKVIRPQINYNGQLIQIADIEVKTLNNI